jgi:flagellar biosynthesis protein FlhB
MNVKFVCFLFVFAVYLKSSIKQCQKQIYMKEEQFFIFSNKSFKVVLTILFVTTVVIAIADYFFNVI